MLLGNQGAFFYERTIILLKIKLVFSDEVEDQLDYGQ
jgi:hypothetical protein